MSINLVGTKLGQTQYFTDDGYRHHVTVVQIQDHFVTQLKSVEKDGYAALQLATMPAKKASKSRQGHLKAADVALQKVLRESRVSPEVLADHKLGSSIGIDWFSEGDVLDITGTSKGKGFAGCVKRHGFSMQDATHGNSLAHRASGSIGQCQDPGRVFKGKKMAGQMGSVRRTVLGLKLLKVDLDKGVILIKGAIPGFNGSMVSVRKSLRHGKKKGDQ